MKRVVININKPLFWRNKLSKEENKRRAAARRLAYRRAYAAQRTSKAH